MQGAFLNGAFKVHVLDLLTEIGGDGEQLDQAVLNTQFYVCTWFNRLEDDTRCLDE